MKILKIILYALGGLVALFLVVALFLPARYEVTRTIEIKQPTEAVYAKVSDLNQWLSWNPWSRQEPSAKNTITGEAKQVGQKWAWEGKVVGKGSMTIGELQTNKSITLQLNFEAPMQDQAANSLLFAPTATGTKVTWLMKGDLAYPIGRYFGLMIDGMIGKDFEDGLRNLKNELEKK